MLIMQAAQKSFWNIYSSQTSFEICETQINAKCKFYHYLYSFQVIKQYHPHFICHAVFKLLKSYSVFKKITYGLIILLTVNFLIWLVTALKFIQYPYSLDFGEGILLVQSSMLIHGQNIYPPIDEYPFIVSNYHPLYPFIAGLPFLFSDPSLWTGRTLTLLSAIGSMIIIGNIVFRSTKKVEIGIIAGLLPLCLNYPYNWAFVYRVDHFAVFLSLLGLFLYMHPPKKGGIFISIIPFAFAFLTKLSFILAPIACLIDLFLKKDKLTTKYLLLSIAGFAVPYLIINAITGFGMFNHTFSYTVNAFHTMRMVEGYREIIGFTLPLWLAAIIGIANPNGKFKTLIISYLVLSSLSIITYGAEGSDSNYFIELLFVLPIAALMWIPSKDKTSEGDKTLFSYRWLVLLAIIFFCLAGRIMESAEFASSQGLNKTIDGGRQIDMFVKNCPGDVISEDLTFIARNNKEMLFLPYIMSLLSRKGKWDQSRFVEDLKNKRFNLLVLRFDVNNPYHTDRPGAYGKAGFDRFTVEMEMAIMENYNVFNPINMGNKSWYLYKPKIQEN